MTQWRLSRKHKAVATILHLGTEAAGSFIHSFAHSFIPKARGQELTVEVRRTIDSGIPSSGTSRAAFTSQPGERARRQPGHARFRTWTSFLPDSRLNPSHALLSSQPEWAPGDSNLQLPSGTEVVSHCPVQERRAGFSSTFLPAYLPQAASHPTALSLLSLQPVSFTWILQSSAPSA